MEVHPLPSEHARRVEAITNPPCVEHDPVHTSLNEWAGKNKFRRYVASLGWKFALTSIKALCQDNLYSFP